MIFDTIPVGQIDTNCYLIGDEKEGVCAVADPGGSPERVLAMIEKSGLRLEKIFLTHGHWDHVGAVDALMAAVPAPGLALYLHPADTDKGDARLFPPLSWGFNHFEDGELISVGSLKVKGLHTPGHSAGSVTLLAEDVMLCGDTLFAGSCGRVDFLDGSEREMMKSLARLGRLEGDYKVCPGHGPLSTLERERKGNPYMRHALGL